MLSLLLHHPCCPPCLCLLQDALWSSLAECSVPLLLVSGELDTKFTASNGRLARRCAAHAEQQQAGSDAVAAADSSMRVALGTIPSAGHALHVEAPLQLLAMLQQWLADLGRLQGS